MRRTLPVVVAAACAAPLALAAGAGGLAPRTGDWSQPNGDLAATRASSSAAISSRTVGELAVRWRFPLRGAGGGFGLVTSTPVVVGDTVYLQDSKSSVLALDRRTGRLRWARVYTAPNDGPNGVAVAVGSVFAATDTTAFALNARTGRRRWSTRLARRQEQFVDIAPVVHDGLVYLSTIGYPPGGRGKLYALEAQTGRVRWSFQTIRDPWRHPGAGGGGAWYPLSVQGGRVYAGISNPGPWGGTRTRPNGGLFSGSSLYADSLVVLDAHTGSLIWSSQVTRHDVRDYDFEASPVLARLRVSGTFTNVVFGAGKGGRVVAWNRATRARIWARPVGTHLHDLGPLPPRSTLVCPGLFGGVLTPMAYAAGRLFVPVVDLCMRESAVTSASVLQRPAEGGKGILYALDGAGGEILWSRHFASPLLGCATVARDVVFAPTYDGRVFGLSVRDGSTLWSTRLRAGINSCPAVAGDELILAAGAPHTGFAHPVAEIVAYGMPARR